MSAWLGHGVPGYLTKHHFKVCMWECLQMRLAFELVDSVKQISEADGSPQCANHLTHREPKTKDGGRENSTLLCLTAWMGTLVFGTRTPIHTINSPGSHKFGFKPHYTNTFLSLQPADGRLWDLSVSTFT